MSSKDGATPTEEMDVKSTPAESSETQPEAQSPDAAELKRQLDSALAQLKAVNAESADRRHRIAQLEAEQQAKEKATMTAEERLAAQETELANAKSQLTTLAEREAAAQAVIKEQLEATVGALSVPPYVMEAISGQTAAEQLQFINTHRADFAKQAPISTDAGKTGGVKGIKSLKDLEGMDADWINANWEAISAKLGQK